MESINRKKLRDLHGSLAELQERCRKLELKCDALASCFPDPLVFCDPTGKIEEVNEQFEATFGWSADELLGTVAPYIPAHARTDHVKRLIRVAEGIEPPFRFRGRSKDGQPLDLMARASRYSGVSSGPSRFLAMFKPVAPAEAGITKTSFLPDDDVLGLHFNAGNVGMIIVDLDTGIACLNRKLIRMTGCASRQSAPEESSDAFEFIKKDTGRRSLWTIIKKGRPHPGIDVPWTRADGTTSRVFVCVSVLHKWAGGMPLMAATIVDITRVHAKEKRLRKKMAGLSARHKDQTRRLRQEIRASVALDRNLRKAEQGELEAKEAVKELSEEYTARLRESLAGELDRTIIPRMDRLRRTNLNKTQHRTLSLLESDLRGLVDLTESPYGIGPRLTPRELQIARMILDGTNHTEIQDILGLTYSSVRQHIGRLRRKLGHTKGKPDLSILLKTFLKVEPDE